MVENRTWMENINELRTPLTIVLCQASILRLLKDMNAVKSEQKVTGYQDSRIGDQAELYGQKITVTANHLLGLINEILDYTSINLGETALEQTSFPVRALLEKVKDQLATAAAEKSSRSRSTAKRLWLFLTGRVA
jgi:signal transduction histidine kinase